MREDVGKETPNKEMDLILDAFLHLDFLMCSNMKKILFHLSSKNDNKKPNDPSSLIVCTHLIKNTKKEKRIGNTSLLLGSYTILPHFFCRG